MTRPVLWSVLGLMALIAVVQRFAFPGRPGFDVDELLYSNIAANWALHGFMGPTPEYIGHPTIYTSHPPFLFLVEGLWFKLVGTGILHARQLTSLAGIVTMIIGAVWVRRRLGNWPALLVAAMLGLDGWVIFTNRVAWAENVQIPLGMLALMGFSSLMKRPSMRRLLLAGMLLGSIMAYKTVGVIFPLAGLLYLLIERQQLPVRDTTVRGQRWAAWRLMRKLIGSRFRYATAFVAGWVAVMAAYLLGMWVWAGQQFVTDTYHQFLRATGQVKSRGTVTSSGQILETLRNNYSIYLVSVLVLGLAGLIIGLRVLQCLLKRNLEPVRRADSLLFAWATGAFFVFGVQRLTLPHYLILIMVPAFCYLTAEAKAWVDRDERSRVRPKVVATLALVVILGGFVATIGRVVVRNDNAVRSTLTWMDTQAPRSQPGQPVRVVADEFIGVNLKHQSYCKITHYQECEQKGGRPDYIIAYTTTTQKLPASQALDRTIRDYCQPVAIFTGFKEKIIVYQVVKRPANG
jgi:4-amino-4-deoxy-L-arabinose transferase-like glycosyltransferase